MVVVVEVRWGGKSSSSAASPAGAASTAGRRPASSSSASWPEAPRHDSSDDTAEPLTRNHSMEVLKRIWESGKAAEIHPRRADAARLSASRLSPSGRDWTLDYIISASEATSSNSWCETELRVGVQEHSLLQNTPLLLFLSTGVKLKDA